MVVTATSPHLALTTSSTTEAFFLSHAPELTVGQRLRVRIHFTTPGNRLQSSLLVLARPGAPHAVIASYWDGYAPIVVGGDLPVGLELRYLPDPVCGPIESPCGVSHSLEAEFAHDGQLTHVARGEVVRTQNHLLGNGQSADWEWGGDCTDSYDLALRSGFAIETHR